MRRSNRPQPTSITHGAINGIYLWRVQGGSLVTISPNKRRAIAEWNRLAKWLPTLATVDYRKARD